MQPNLCLVGTVDQVIAETADELSDPRIRSIEHIIVSSNSNITIDSG